MDSLKRNTTSAAAESEKEGGTYRSMIDMIDEGTGKSGEGSRNADTGPGWTSARYLDPSRIWTFSLGLLLSACFYGLILLFAAFAPYPGVERITDMFLRNSNLLVVVPACVLFFWSVSILNSKRAGLRKQQQALDFAIIPKDAGFVLNGATAQDVLKRLDHTVEDPDGFLLLRRVRISLSNLNNLGQVSDVSEVLRGEADEDENRLENSFSLIHSFVWAIPVLGFIGTAIGLSLAIGEFASVLASVGEIEELQNTLQSVTGGLGTAFETTLVGLFLALILHISASVEENDERRFLNDCTIYCQEKIVSRLKIERDST